MILAATTFVYSFYLTRGGEHLTTSGEAIDSVAVLPFVNESGDPNTEYLSDGISDSIINSLSRLPNLKVKSLNAVLRYKGKQIDPQTVGRESECQGGVDGQDDAAREMVWRSAPSWWTCATTAVCGASNITARCRTSSSCRTRSRGRFQKGCGCGSPAKRRSNWLKQYTENTEAYLLYSLGRYYFRQRYKRGI